MCSQPSWGHGLTALAPPLSAEVMDDELAFGASGFTLSRSDLCGMQNTFGHSQNPRRPPYWRK